MVPKPKRNNAQHQPLTTVLRNIIREYPPGGGVLRELCQNADDSGATTIEFVLDLNQHPTDNLLHDRLAEYQGPSLLAYNDRPFSETDFLSLSRIGDSEKAHDESSTGKFGRGFNSVYNWTDGPTILSGNSLLLLDPHHYWSPDVHQPGGPLYDFVADSTDPAMVNQLSPFRRHVSSFSQSFDGTVIRLPLRTAEQASRSEIIQRRDRKPTTVDDIKEAFMSYATEISESLLFLRHISSITLKIGDTVFAKAVGRKFHGAKDVTNAFSIEEPYSSVLIRGDKPQKDEQFVMEISFQKQGALHVSRYAITHHMRHKADNPELQKWARSYKLFPWVAVAFPMSYNHDFRGRLFSTLPLPPRIQHPAHIHAMFSITPDRQSIHSANDSTISESAEAKKGALWNRWIFQELVVHAWVTNLQFINDLSVKTDSGMTKWLHWPTGKQEHSETSIPGTEILGAVFKKIVAQKRELLPTICDTTARGSEAIFASELDKSLRNALRNARVEVICPPNDRLYELAQIPPLNIGVRHISPGVIRFRLTALSKSLGLDSLDSASRSVLLDYILSDNSYQSIGKCQAPLLPILDGTYRSFSFMGARYRFSQKDETLIFEDCKAYLIDTTKLSQKALDIFTTGIQSLQKYTSISPWSLSGASWYCQLFVFKDEISRRVSDDTIYRPDISVEWIDRFWNWAIAKDRQEVVTSLAGLWLLPLAGQRYHKIGSASKALGVFGPGHVAEVLRGILETSAEASRRYPVFIGHEKSPATVNFFRGMGIVMDCSSFEELVKWLTLFPGFLSELGNDERAGVVNCLGTLAGQRLPQPVRKRVTPLLRKLPLFRDAFGTGPECTWISLDKPGMRYVVVPDESTLSDLWQPETTFISVSDPAAASLLRTFSLADIPLSSDLLEKYVIPTMSECGDKARIALSKYILQPRNALDLSQKAQEILKLLPFVPVHGKPSLLKCPSELVDPESTVAKLYFDDESVFPDNKYLQEFRDSLHRLGMITSITEPVIFNRLDTYSKLPLQIDKLSEMLQHLFVAAPKPPVLEDRYVELKWVPASMGGVMTLCSPCDCRNSHQKALVKYSMPLTELEVGPWWSKQLGWDRAPAVHHILKQLDEAVKHQDNEVITALLDSGWLYIDDVANQLEDRAWIPGASGGYYRHSDVFLRNAQYHPYIDNISPQVAKYFNRSDTLATGRVRPSPLANKLKEIQNIIVRKGPLSDNDLVVFVSLLEALPAHGAKIDLKQWKAPDIGGVLHDLADLTAGDPLHDAGQEKAVTNLKFLHPNVTPRTIKFLKISNIQDRFLDQRVGAEFSLDFAQDEDPVSAISDTLQRYPFESTFNEYLANAEDSRSARKICWVVDRTENYPDNDDNLITPRLRECAGAALVCYNNGVFSDKDFEAVVKIGVNRRDNPLKIGRFGRGSLTMYHWTCTPCFVSGKYFAIFDPEQTRLPKSPATGKPRRGMHLLISVVRQLWPDQLRPFEGLFGFNEHTTEFEGTIFRFPIMESRAKSDLYSGGLFPLAVRCDPVDRAVRDYYEDASISLLFLENIGSIASYERLSKSAGLVKLWGVSVVYRKPISMPHLTQLKMYCEGEHVYQEKPKKTKWLVLRSTISVSDTPDSIQATCRRHKLQPRCAIAAQISKIRPAHTGRLFLDLPTPTNLGIPVHISADLAVNSDRQIRHIHDSDGGDWNSWLLQSELPALYISLLEAITRTRVPGCSVYDYWPRYSNRNASDISSILTTQFWQNIVESDCSAKIFPIQRSITGNLQTITAAEEEYVSYREARFNLLEPDYRTLCDSFLPKLDLGDWKLIKPFNEAQKGLQKLVWAKKQAINHISPSFMAELFKSQSNANVLMRCWKSNYHSDIGFINRLLKFILTEATPDMLMGCMILPLGDNSLGCLQAMASGSQKFPVLPFDSLIESTVLQEVPNALVHPGLDSGVLGKLVSGNRLNVSHFSPADLPRLFERFSGKSQQCMKLFLEGVWKWYNQMQAQSSEAQKALIMLTDLNCLIATTPGAISEYCFLSLRSFRTFETPAILGEPLGLSGQMRVDWDFQALRTVLRSFQGDGLLLVDQDAFPWHLHSEESLENNKGIYRFLRCIEAMAYRKQQTVEAFIRSKFHEDPEYPVTLGKVVRCSPWSDINFRTDEIRNILKQLPILPAGQLKHDRRQWLSGNSALRAPVARRQLKLEYLSSASKFVDNDWAAIPSNNRDLEFLQLVPISIPSFLKEHVSVNEGAKLPVDELDRYIQILEWLKKEFPESMRKSPVALDGSLTFRMANTLYDHSSKAFEAAFHAQASVKFVHRKLRRFEFTDTIKNIDNPNIYLECVTALQQLANPVASIDSEEVTERAKHVAEFLQWDTPQLRTVCAGGVVQRLGRIQFVPALHVHPNGTERNAAIGRLVPEGRLISLPEGVLQKFMDVCWSQKPFFDQELSSFVLLKIPGQGRPSADTVVMHLVYLSQRREYISLDEIPKFIQSATACYGYLRDLKLQTLTVPPNEEIWFNTDNESPGPGRDEFLESWVSTRNLCLGLDYDSGPLKIARSSLQNYIGLLKTCNVRTIRGPRAQPPPAPSDTKHSDTVLSQFQLFRHEGRFTDFTIIVQDTSLEVHKTLLCATSEYFQTMFSSQLSEAAEGKVYWTDIGLEAATRVVDFFYTGELTPVKRSDDPTDEIELLLELLLASDRYMLPALKTKVERALWSNRYIRPETVMTILKCAIDYSANKLRGVCEEYHAENSDVIQRES